MTRRNMFYYLYALITMPGVVLHELGHAFFCVFSGIKVHEVKLFRFGNPAGYVVHDEPTKFLPGLLISLGPLLINSLLALLCFSQVKAPYLAVRPALFLWLGLALGLHAIPSTGDAKAIFNLANHRFWRNPLVIISYPFILLLYILNLLKRLHIDIVYVAVLFWLGNIYLK